MSSTRGDLTAIERWARQPGPTSVLAAARDRLERGRAGATALRVALTEEERHQVGQLLGLDWQVSGRPPTLKALRGALEPYDLGLEALLEHLGGPLVDRPALRAATRASLRDEREQARRLLVQSLPAELVEAAAVHCLPVHQPLRRAEQLVTIARRLPAPVYLPVLAADCFADSHALDRNRSLGRAAARMAALIGGGAALGGSFTAQQWRDSWAGVGVSCDRVSTMVLILNLPLTGTAAVRAVTGCAGEPVWLTARLLDQAGPPDPLPPNVFVCENPSIVETAADRLGACCQPLVCTFGIASQAALGLISMLAGAGVALRVRADNDAAGQAIVAAVRAAAPQSVPWRYGPDSPVYEEQLVDSLVQDLSRPGGSSCPR